MHEDHDSALDDSRTEQLARDLDEQVRRLNHATADPSGLNHPGTAYSVLGSLSAVAGRLDQTIAQLNAFLRREEKAGRLGHDQGQPTASACDAFGRALSAARVHADHLSASIADAQCAIAPLHTIERGSSASRPTLGEDFPLYAPQVLKVPPQSSAPDRPAGSAQRPTRKGI